MEFTSFHYVLTLLVSLATANTLRKCCELDQTIINFKNCVPTSTNFSQVFKESFNLNLRDFKVKFDKTCGNRNKFFLDREFDEDHFNINSAGVLEMSVLKRSFVSEDYCVDLFNGTLGAFYCDQDVNGINGAFTSNAIGMIISMPFLLVTLIVYALLPERNVHAKCLMCYVSSLMCAYMFLVIMQFSANLKIGCIVLAILCLYFFMTSFCWMNISCIDIFWTFSGKRGFGLTNKSAEMKRFLLYCTYTYGLPLILIGLVLGLNNMEDKSAWYHPNFANAKCWLGSGYPLLIYFYGPMGIMLVFNIVLFTLTALKIRQINNDTAMLNKAESQKHYENDKQTFNLYFKLLLALGINWIMEFISWLVDWLLPEHKKIPEIWYLTDFCNAIYGVFIFIIFVCKRNILILLKKRYYIFMGQPQKARNLSMRTSSYEMSQTEKTVVY